MPKSGKPRKRYQPRDYRAEAARLDPERYGEPTKSVPVDKEPPAPAHPHVVHPSSPRAPRGRGRYLVPVAAGAGVIGGGAFLAHRARRKKAEMAKGLIDPTTGESVSYERTYLDDEVDKAFEEKPRGALVAKAGMPKRAAVLMRAGQGATIAGRGARTAGRGVRTAARQPGKFLGSYIDNAAEGSLARGTHAIRGGKIGAARRAGAVTSASGGGTLLAFGAGHLNGRLDAEGNTRVGPADRKRANTSKRYDETAVEHHGSRRSGRTPVSSVRRVPGLPVGSATFSRGDAEARPGTRSHANKLTHVRNGGAKGRTGKLVVIRHGHRSKSGSTVGKSVGFAQSAGNGRRLVEV